MSEMEWREIFSNVLWVGERDRGKQGAPGGGAGGLEAACQGKETGYSIFQVDHSQISSDRLSIISLASMR